MLGVEVGRDPAEVGSTGRDGQRQLVGLPGIADVGEAGDDDRLAGHAFGDEGALGLGLELAVAGVQHLRRGAPAADRQRPHELVLDLGQEQAGRAEDARRERHEHAAHLQRARDRGGDHRPVAAEAAEHEVARIPAAVGRDRLDRSRHRRDGELEDAVGGLGRVPAERRRHRLERARGRVGIDRDRPARQVLGVQVAEHDQRVRQRRRVAAEAVAGRARDRRPRSRGRRAASRTRPPRRGCRRPRRSRTGR